MDPSARFIFKCAGKYGFINNEGRIVVEPIYDGAYSFTDGLAAVKVNNKCGYIDREGNILVAPQYDSAYPFFDGLAIVRNNNKYGYLDTRGNIAIPIEYKYVTHFSEGYAFVSKRGLFMGFEGIIDKNNRLISRLKADMWIDYVLEMNCLCQGTFFSEGLAGVRMRQGLTGYGFIDKHCNVIVEPKFSSENLPIGYVNGIASLADGYFTTKYICIDKSGNKISSVTFDRISSFKEGLACVYDKKIKRYGYINNKCNLIIEPKYSDASNFSESLAPVSINGKYGYIDYSGKTIIPLQYDKSYRFINGMALVKTNSKCYYIDNMNNKIFETEHIGMFGEQEVNNDIIWHGNEKELN